MAKNQIGGGQISSIAVVLAIFLLIILAWYYYSLYKQQQDKKNKATWPPNGYNACPDYWVKNGNDICINPHSVGLPDCPISGITKIQDPLDSNKSIQAMDFSGELYKSSNSNSNYNKCIFSKKCQAPWEGIDSLCA